jgi:hypothetical protein
MKSIYLRESQLLRTLGLYGEASKSSQRIKLMSLIHKEVAEIMLPEFHDVINFISIESVV